MAAHGGTWRHRAAKAAQGGTWRAHGGTWRAHGGTWRAQGCKDSTRQRMACTWRPLACTWRHMACAGLQRLHKAVAAPALHSSQLRARRQCERLSHVVRATERRHPVGRAVPHGAHHMGECAAQRLLGGKAKPSPTCAHHQLFLLLLLFFRQAVKTTTSVPCVNRYV